MNNNLPEHVQDGAAGPVEQQDGLEDMSSAQSSQSSEETWETASGSDAVDAPSEGDGPGPSAAAGASASAQDKENLGCGRHGCPHYRRRCKLLAPCCGEAVWCRHCHNAEKNDSEQDPRKRHVLDRKAVKEVVCALCNTQQPAARTCRECGVAFGRYACLKCNFFDDDITKRQFHCDKCGICRVGGEQNYFHCDTCNCCYAVQLRNTHVCVENSMHQNCPVCFEYLFDSVKPINVMPCGHTIHQECLKNMAEHATYVCPVCTKCYLSPAQSSRLWAEMDDAVAATPMPQEYSQVQVDVLCNDCSGRSRVKFHVVGHKCTACGGYNTRRV